MKRISLAAQLRSVKTLTIGIVLFLVGTAIGIALSFPSKVFEQRLVGLLEQQGHISISNGSFSLGFINLTAKHVTIDGQPDKNIPALHIDRAKISPLWSSLFSANRGFHLDSQLMSGELIAEVREKGEITATAQNLILDIPLENGWNLNLLGKLETANLDTAIPLTNASQSEVDLTLSNVSLREEGKDKPMLTLGNITLKAKGKGQAFRITELSAQNGDFELQGRGNLRLGSSPQNSTVSLRVNLKAAPSADPGLVELLKVAAKEKPNGDFEVRISGNLASPSIH